MRAMAVEVNLKGGKVAYVPSIEYREGWTMPIGKVQRTEEKALEIAKNYIESKQG